MKPSITINPHKLENLSEIGIVEYWSVPLLWLMDGNDSVDESIDGETLIRRNYQFGVFEINGGCITDNGVFTFPQDPELKPLIKICRGDEQIYCYESAIIGVVRKDGTSFVTRID